MDHIRFRLCKLVAAIAILISPTVIAASPVDAQSTAAPTIIAIPGGEAGIGFDDIGYSPALGRTIIPAAQTGAIFLIDPASLKLERIAGFTPAADFHGGHGEGVTSADAAGGFIFATDRTATQLDVIDAASHKLVASAALADGPDYVRYVAPIHEVWVTEPRTTRIETFSLASGKPTHSGFIDIAGGPEALVIDDSSGRAFTNLWTDSTLAIDLKSHRELARWKNGCAGSRGLALDNAHGHLLVGCKEGRLEVIDSTSGNHLGEAVSGSGVDIIGFNPALSHAYLPGAKSATMATIQIASSGEAKVLGTIATTHGAHCATPDNLGKIYVCDPVRGRILVFTDQFR